MSSDSTIEESTVLDELASVPPDNRDGLAGWVYAAIRRGIADGSLQPGYRLREVEISRRFDVSNTPVREALHRLEYEGLVTSTPNKGASVTPIEWPEVHSLLIVRELLEVYAVRRVAETSKLHDFSKIGEVLGQQAVAVEAGDRKQFSELDREFHLRIVTLTGNNPLVRFTELAHTHLQKARSKAAPFNSLSGMRRSLLEHRAIFEALEQGQAEKAEQAIRRHVQSTIQTIAALIEEDHERSSREVVAPPEAPS